MMTVGDQPRARDEAWRALTKMATIYRQSHLLYAALELQVFSRLSEDGAKAEQLAAEIGLDLLPATLLLNGLVGVGLLKKIEGRFYAEPSIQELLGAGEHSVVDQLLQHKAQNPAWLGMADILRGNAERPHESYESILFASDHMDGYLKMVRSVNAPDMAGFIDLVVAHLPRAANVLDLGGGHGEHAVLLLDRLPSAEVTLLDLPKAIEVCDRLQAKNPHRARLHLRSGDALLLSSRDEFDGIMTSDMMHSFDAEGKRRIIANCIKALRPGGILAISKFRRLRDADDTASTSMFALKVYLNSHGGYLESDEEVHEMLAEADLEGIESRRIGSDKTVIIARKPARASCAA
ncbi:class I SAM-dependent methyltransferase [Inquilinus sp. Marseille-Q2685]|uniref:class I SAM-dependent methyltransferase n=1 Tax=Inquilinus sp. Marseille-Q2685 TaxID=2866581 RepID=UPI001CE4AC63|nr:class I SAM-dependent methyltransferase [Inquilinus sp. Marseille-Q2685]